MAAGLILQIWIGDPPQGSAFFPGFGMAMGRFYERKRGRIMGLQYRKEMQGVTWCKSVRAGRIETMRVCPPPSGAFGRLIGASLGEGGLLVIN